MKIENFDECKNIIERIKQHEEVLTKLESPHVTIAINYDNERGRITTIGVYHTEHDHRVLADNFIKGLRADLQSRIRFLKEKLEIL